MPRTSRPDADAAALTDPQEPAESTSRPPVGAVYLATAGLLVGLVLLGASVTSELVRAVGPDPLRGFLCAAGVAVLWIGVVTLVVAGFSPKPLAARLGLAGARLSRRGWWAAILGGLALSQATDLVLQLSGTGRGPALGFMIEALGGAHGRGLALALLIVGLGAGTVEELFFRGFAQRRLVARYGGPVGIAIAAAIFALAHGDPRHAAFAFCFGVFVGAVARWSDSTAPAIAVHVVNNTVSVLTIAAGFDGLETRLPRVVLALAGVALAAVAVASLRVVRREAAEWTPPTGLG